MGTKFDGDRLSRGINFMEIVCPGGKEVGDQKSGDQMGLGPNASQPQRRPNQGYFLGFAERAGNTIDLVYFSSSSIIDGSHSTFKIICC